MSFFISMDGIAELWALVVVCIICAAGLLTALIGGLRDK